MLIYEQYIVLEARIQMWLKPKLQHNRIMVTIDVSIDTV